MGRIHTPAAGWDTDILGVHCRYFEDVPDQDGKAYGMRLLNYQHLQMVAFITDLLLVFKILQERLQSDNLNPVSMQVHVNTFKNTIQVMKNDTALLGGWEERLSEEIETESASDDGEVSEKLKWHGIELNADVYERRGAWRRIRTNEFVRAEILDEVIRLTDRRFEETEELFHVFSPFINLDPDADVKRAHELIGRDLELVMLNIQFTELCQSPELKKLNFRQLISHLAADRDSFGTVLTAFSRIAAATPHSADVERTISANNILKTKLRASLELTTENKYLFIHFNLPPLIEWNPRKSVIHWINKKTRREHVLSIGDKKRKATKQRHFAGIFPTTDEMETRSIDSDYSSGEESIINLHENKRRKLN